MMKIKQMFKTMKTKDVFLIIVLVFLIWFFIFRSKELSLTYDSIEPVTTSANYVSPRMSMKSMAINESASQDMALGSANLLSASSLSDEDVIEESGATTERYRENKYYRVDTESFDSMIENITKDIEGLNGIVKSNNQNSNKKVVYEREFYPRLQTIEFTIDNSATDIERIEKTLKKWGDIRISNSNKTSIEQELTRYEQQLKEMEEARKALQNSKDKDWIARQDSDLAKRSERIKNQIENAKKQSTYKTYNVDVYEVIKFRVNALKYWYGNNYSLKDAIANVLPDMVGLFAKLIPITLMTIVLIVVISVIYQNNKHKVFKKELEILKEEFSGKEVNFNIKL